MRYAIRVASAAAGLIAAAASAQTVPPRSSGAFLMIIGNDTVGVDRFIRTRDTLYGEFIVRFPRTTVTQYVLAFDASGMPSSFQYGPADASGRPIPGAATVSMAFSRGTATVRTGAGGSTSTDQFAVQDATVPILLPFMSYALFGEAVRLGLRGSVGAVDLPMRVLWQNARGSAGATMRRTGDTVRISYLLGSTLVARLNAAGEVVEWDGRESLMRALAPRVPWETTGALAADWSARDARGAGLGTLSPRDTARGRVGDAEVIVDYSRPRTRGRAIFGTVVPYGLVWRAGADAATQLTATSDVEIGGKRLAAGRYTLWILPSDSLTATLIVNRQTGQWGTDYRPAQDVLRVPLHVRAAQTVVTDFTISLRDGELMFTWDRTTFAVATTQPARAPRPALHEVRPRVSAWSPVRAVSRRSSVLAALPR